MTTNDITGIYHKRLSAATAPLIGSIISQCFSEGRGRESRVEKGKGNQELGSRHNSPSYSILPAVVSCKISARIVKYFSF